MQALIGIALLLPKVAFAQQPAWGQCGGTGWTGGKTCVSGYACVVSNQYYSQCIPSSSAPSVPSSTSSSIPAPSGTSAPQGANYWFSFGDSYTQTGFLINETLPSPGNPLGNPPYPGYTSTGGDNWIDVCTVQYNKSLVLTYNFAYGGATIDASLVQPFEPTVLSLTDQVNSFLSTVGKKPASTPWTSSNALFSTWIGINDIGNSYYNGNGTTFDNTLLDAYFNLISKLYAVGARNFLFINVPPVDRSPLMLAQASSAQALEKAMITDFNTKLASRAASFQSANPGVKTWVFDSNAAFTTILNNPTAYGFSDATSYGNANSFWVNNLHPTAPAQEIFGKEIGSLLGSTVW